jgi:uncharacterized iron-regulated membrane protein
MAQLQHVKQNAYVSIVTMVILMLIVLTATVTVITVQIDGNLSYRTNTDSAKARANVDACVDVAINKLKENAAYSGGETLNTDHGTCQVVSVTGSGNTNRVITVQGDFNYVTRKAQVTISQVNPLTSISSWLEIP